MASVTMNERGDRYTLRWREVVLVDGKQKTRHRRVSVSTQEAAIELRATILRAIETEGRYRPPEPEPEEPVEPPVGDLEKAAVAWLRHKAARYVEGTRRKYASTLNRLFADIRAESALGESDRVPVSVLSRDLFSRLLLRWRREGLSDSTQYTASRIALDVWRWAADEPEVYPGTPTPPRVSSRVLANPPVYSAPPAPTLEEVDACIRCIRPAATIAYRCAIVMRFTGLRAGQVLAIRGQDVDFGRGTLRVTTGKSRRERAAQRVLPLSPHLVAYLRAWDTADEDLVVPRPRARAGSRYVPARTLREAWEEATQAGEARREVWAPPTRGQARPDHAFRAAFQSFMEEQGVRAAVIDHLVGHAPQSVRGRHYSPAKPDELLEAVRLLPVLEEPQAGANVVSLA